MLILASLVLPAQTLTGAHPMRQATAAANSLTSFSESTGITNQKLSNPLLQVPPEEVAWRSPRVPSHSAWRM